MGMPTVQYDFSSGLDLSGLTSVSQAQLMQAINQIAPLSNIGGVLYGTPTQFGPSFIAANPRCIRYLLLDSSTNPPTPKYWNTAGGGSWDSVTVADGSVSATKLAAHTNSPALNHFFDAISGNGVIGNANKVLVYDSNGEYITQLARSAFMTGYLLPITQIDPSGADNTLKYIRYNGAIFEFAAFDPSSDLTNGAVPIAKLAPGTSGYIPQSNGSSLVATSTDAIMNGLTGGSTIAGINISKLRFDGTAYAQLRQDSTGSALEYAVDPNIWRSGSLTFAVAEGRTDLGVHSLGDVPDIIQAYAVAVDTTYNWPIGSYIPLGNNLVTDGGTEGLCAYSMYASASNLYYHIRISASSLSVRHGTAAAPTVTTGVSLATFSSKFNLVVFAARYNR